MNCLKSISITCVDVDKISVTMTGFESDVEYWKEEIGRKLDAHPVQETRSQKGTYTTITVMYEKNYALLTENIIYKAIPAELNDIYERGIIPKAMFSIDTYSAVVKLHFTPDKYTAISQTADEVLKQMGLNVAVPAQLNYNVNNLSTDIGVGTKKVIRQLFPIPGTTINDIGGMLYVNIDYPEEVEEVADDDCVISTSKRQLDLSLKVLGTSGEPRYVIGRYRTERQPCGFPMAVIYNLVGGVFAITHYSITKEDVQERVDLWPF